MAELRKYGVATKISVPLVDYGATDFEDTPVTVPTGDIFISKDEGAFANATVTGGTHLGQGIYSIELSATEMQAGRIAIAIRDQDGTKTYEDQAITIDTYGNASAEHAFDLDTATQSVNVSQISGDSTAADNLELDYDGTGYAKANSTIGTCTTNTDMRGTDSALLAASAPTNFGDLAITVTTGKVTVGTNDDKTGYSLTADQSTVTIGTINEVAGTVSGNVIQISGDSTAADNAELFFDDTGFAASNSTIGTVTTVTNGVTVTTNNDKTGYSISGTKQTLDALNDISTAQVNTEVDTALTDIGLDHLVSASVTGTDVADNSVIAKMTSKAATADFDTFDWQTDSLEAIRDNQVACSGDWTSGEKEQIRDALGVDGSKTTATGGQLQVIDTNLDSVKSTVDTNLDTTVSSRSTFDYTSNQVIVTTNNDKAGYSLAVDQSGVTIGTVNAVAGTVSGNVVQISGDATAADNAELFFDNTGFSASNSTIGTATTVTNGVTVTTNNDKTGYSISGTKQTLDALNDVSTAQVNTEVDTALSDIGLDHMLSASVTGSDVADNSVVAKITSKAATADFDTFDWQTDSLEALRDNQTAGGDWSAAEKEQIRDSLGVDGTKTTATGGQLQVIDSNVDSIKSTVDTNLDTTVSSRSDFDETTDQVIVSTVNDKTGYSLAIDQSGVTIGTVNEVAGTVSGNIVQISDDATAAQNLEADYDGTGYSKTASTINTVTNVTNGVTVTTNNDKAGYDLNADQTAVTIGEAQTVGTVTGNVDGSVNSVTTGVTVTTNNDKTGYDLNADQSAVTIGEVQSVHTVTGSVDSVTNGVTLDPSATSAQLVDDIWDEAQSGHTVTGTFGSYVDAKVSDQSGLTDWTTAEKAQIRDAIGVDGSKTTATGGQLQTIDSNVDSIKSTVDTNLDTTVSSRSDFDETTDQVIVSTVNDKTGYSLAADQSAVTIGEVQTVGTVTGNVDGSVNSVTTGVTVTTNNDKTGYSLTSGERDSITDSVWDELQAGHTVTGSFGSYLDQKISTGSSDWSAAERAQIRDSLGVDGSKTTATGGQLQTIDSNIDSIKSTVDTNLDATISSRSDFDESTNQVIVSTVNDKTGYSLAADQSGVTIGEVQTVGTVTGNVDGSVDSVTDAVTVTGNVGLSTATQQSIADETLKRSVSNVEDSAAEHSLATTVLQQTESTTVATAGKLTIYKTDGTTVYLEKDVTDDSGAPPITGIS